MVPWASCWLCRHIQYDINDDNNCWLFLQSYYTNSVVGVIANWWQTDKWQLIVWLMWWRIAKMAPMTPMSIVMVAPYHSVWIDRRDGDGHDHSRNSHKTKATETKITILVNSSSNITTTRNSRWVPTVVLFQNPNSKTISISRQTLFFIISNSIRGKDIMKTIYFWITTFHLSSTFQRSKCHQGAWPELRNRLVIAHSRYSDYAVPLYIIYIMCVCV